MERCPGPGDFAGEFYQRLKKNQYKYFTNSSKKLEMGTLPNSLYEARITLIPKPEKNTTRKSKTKQNKTKQNKKTPTDQYL